MDTVLIDGNKLAEQILAQIADDIRTHNLQPQLDIIQVGADPASKIYINMKQKAGQRLGIKVNLHEFEYATTDKLSDLIKQVNSDSRSHGVIIQLPLPRDIDKNLLFGLIDPQKDVDGMSPVSLGNLWQGAPAFASATPLAVMECIKQTGLDLCGAKVVIINHSTIIGKPLAALLLKQHASVSICHKYTKDLLSYTQDADIVISGVGKSGLITSEHIKSGAIVIDVGINDSAVGVAGDVEASGMMGKASYLTPVPGGVGPMTVAMLLKNVVIAAKNLA